MLLGGGGHSQVDFPGSAVAGSRRVPYAVHEAAQGPHLHRLHVEHEQEDDHGADEHFGAGEVEATEPPEVRHCCGGAERGEDTGTGSAAAAQEELGEDLDVGHVRLVEDTVL